MAILKLAEALEEMTMDISEAQVIEGKYGEQVAFDNPDGDTLFVPLKSVVRQLDRIGVAEVNELTGRRIHFSRSDGKNGTIYWNLDKARDRDTVQPPKAAKPVVADALPAKAPYVQKETGRLPGEEPEFTNTDWFTKYADCAAAAQYVWGEISDEAAVAACATLFIYRMKAGV